MPHNLAEISRKVENMIRIGTIVDVNHTIRRCRVKSGKLTTDWLNWQAGRAGSTKIWNPPTIGEQVMILSPSGVIESGIVMPSIYSDVHDSPSSNQDEHITEYPDGARISYNHATGALIASGIKTGIVQASVSITLDTPHTEVTGSMNVEGLFSYQNGISGTGGGNGNIISGSLTQTGGTLSSNGIVLDAHDHQVPVGKPV